MGEKSENLKIVLDYLRVFHFAVKIFNIRTTRYLTSMGFYLHMENAVEGKCRKFRETFFLL